MSDLASEVWRPIPGYEGAYEASDKGRVRSLDRYVAMDSGKGGPNSAYEQFRRGRVLRPSRRKDGYLWTRLGLVHNLIAAAFLGPRPAGHYVAHNNGRKGENAPSNLRYALPVDNSQDMFAHGTVRLGEMNPSARLTVREIAEIRRLHRTGAFLQREIAERFGVSQGHVSRLVRCEQWRHV